MSTRTTDNRPFKFGAGDKREFIVSNAEREVRCQNDANGNPVYVGFAKEGSAEGDLVWQIMKITWDATFSVTDVEWPQNTAGSASTNYEFSWTSRALYTYV